MNYLLGMNLGKTVKKLTVQVLMIPTATPPFGLGYMPTDDDLLEMESPYEVRTSDEDEEGRATPGDDDAGSDAKSNSSSDSNSSDDGHSDDDNNNDSEPPSDREDEDAELYYEEYDDVDYYDEDIKDDAEANRWSDTDTDQYKLINILEDVVEEVEQANDVDYDDYPYRRPSDWRCITDVNLRSGPQYDKHGREIPKLGS
ncbi:hypothetical protein SO802_026568 [Lithocarpus litseifolius]|uniref:Uncharacterized protein n=1 Tax=Lithocarpus litseifolius TaxID=425828 RepID=A0AAW2C0V2_9ROSI